MRQGQVLAFISRFIEAHRYAPSIREIGAAMGLHSTGTVEGYLGALERKGKLERQHGQPRTLRVLSLEVCPLCGTPGSYRA